MTEINTTTATPAPKKSTKAQKTPAANGKAESNGHTKTVGLRKPQIRILQCLAKASSPMPRKDIATKAPCDLAFLTEYMGSNDLEVRAKNDVKVCKSLLTLGYVKLKMEVQQGQQVESAHYEISANGRKALEKALKA